MTCVIELFELTWFVAVATSESLSQTSTHKALLQADSRVKGDPSLPVVIIDYLLPVLCGEAVHLSTSELVWKKAPRLSLYVEM